MLANEILKSFVPTVKPAEAKAFYRDVLGLKLLSEDNYALEFDSNGTLLRVITVPELKPHDFTALGWNVKDIVATIHSLNAKGVFCESMSFCRTTNLASGQRPAGQKLPGLKTRMGIFCR